MLQSLKTLRASLRENGRIAVIAVLFVAMGAVCECILPFVMAKLIDSSGVDWRDIAVYGAALAVLAAAALVFGVFAGTAAGVRYRAHGRRRESLAGAAPDSLHCARRRGGYARAHPRRGDELHRYPHRKDRPGGHRPAHGGAHDLRHRAPALYRAVERLYPRARSRAGRRTGIARGTHCPPRRILPSVYGRGRARVTAHIMEYDGEYLFCLWRLFEILINKFEKTY